MVSTTYQPGPVSDAEPELAEFGCQNPHCAHYLRKGQGNLRIDSRYGKAQSRLLYCRTCGQRFSERKGSMLFGAQLSPETVSELLRCLEQGYGIRGTARLLGINRNTVMRYDRNRRNRPTNSDTNPLG